MGCGRSLAQSLSARRREETTETRGCEINYMLGVCAFSYERVCMRARRQAYRCKCVL